MIDNGRFPPAVVLHLAQRIVSALAEAEAIGLIHGDLRAASLMCPEDGDAFLTHPGLRAIVRPAEGYALADLAPEAYETLAPERIATGSPPTIASDIYACGCLWWQLLAGRSPLAGGNSLARLQAAHAARVPDIRRVAPDTPEPLWRAIDRCLARDPAARPASFADLARLVGPRDPARSGRAGPMSRAAETRAVGARFVAASAAASRAPLDDSTGRGGGRIGHDQSAGLAARRLAPPAGCVAGCRHRRIASVTIRCRRRPRRTDLAGAPAAGKGLRTAACASDRERAAGAADPPAKAGGQPGRLLGGRRRAATGVAGRPDDRIGPDRAARRADRSRRRRPPCPRGR